MKKIYRYALWISLVGLLVISAIIWANNKGFSHDSRNIEDSDTDTTFTTEEVSPNYADELGSIDSFLGSRIILNDSVMEQIAAIAQQDERLSYADSIIQICDVRWRVNLDFPRIMLVTSVSPYNPKMKQVIDYLNEIYGEHDKDTGSGLDYRWLCCCESNSTNTSVRLR